MGAHLNEYLELVWETSWLVGNNHIMFLYARFEKKDVQFIMALSVCLA